MTGKTMVSAVGCVSEFSVTKDKQFSPHRILPPHSKANRPTRELRTEVHVKSHVRTGPALLMAFATQEDFSPMAKPVVVT